MEFKVITHKGEHYVFDAQVKMDDNGKYTINLRYGYHTTKAKHTEKWDSPLHGQSYTTISQVLPHEGDTIIHIKSGRRFTLGADELDFIMHRHPLTENGQTKAYVLSEDYYKD